jgi:hypothetical protein
MTAETSTQMSPWPLAEATLAELPFSRYLWDGSPVRSATEAEAAEYARRLTSPEWQRLYCHAPGYVAPVIAEGLPPVAELDEVAADEPDARDIAIARPGALALVVAAAADESAGLVLTEYGREDPSAVVEGDAAAVDLPWPGAEPTSPEVVGTAEARPGQPDETAVIPAVEDFTQAIPAVTDGTDGDGQA